MIYLIAIERSLNWFFILFGILLVANASVPPFPSFFPEVMIVINILNIRMLSVFMFAFLSVIVCYYNAFSFIVVSHVKPIRTAIGSVKFINGLNILLLVYAGLATLV